MIETVIFDMDGVIIDSEPVHFMIEKEMFNELNIAVSFKEHCSYVGTSSRNMWKKIIEKYGVTESLETLVNKQYNSYLDHLSKENLHPIPGVIELIEDLHRSNFKMAIASSSYMKVIDIVLNKLNLSGYFVAKVSGTELANSKPHPEIFTQSVKLAGSEPGQCVVIEDSENGITSAKAAGIKCIGYLNPNSGMQDLSGADMIVKSFDELNADVIKNI